jgi:predicted nucleotidyltransferase
LAIPKLLNWIEAPAAPLYIEDMIDLIQQKRGELTSLCRQFKVDRLDLFGSAATGKFDPSSSDLDFIIEFEDRSAPGLLNRYLDFAEALERLFGRHVDLLTPRSIRNPYFRQTLDSTKENLYDRGIQATHP